MVTNKTESTRPLQQGHQRYGTETANGGKRSEQCAPHISAHNKVTTDKKNPKHKVSFEGKEICLILKEQGCEGKACAQNWRKVKRHNKPMFVCLIYARRSDHKYMKTILEKVKITGKVTQMTQEETKRK